jgi:hypothetical protein
VSTRPGCSSDGNPGPDPGRAGPVDGVEIVAPAGDLRFPGVAGVRMVPAEGQSRGAPGDAALLDFRKGFFAVGDSPDRSPDAARRFMTRFAAMLSRDLADAGPPALSGREYDRVKDEILRGARGVLEATPPSEICTFTGVFISATDEGLRMVVLHTGDSLLCEYSRETGILRRISVPNFWMAGRSRRFYQEEDIGIQPGGILFLATDGISQAGFPGDGTGSQALSRLGDCAVEDIPGALIENGLRSRPHDDITLMSLDPGGFFATQVAVTAGPARRCFILAG